MKLNCCKLNLSTPSTSANLGPGFDCLGVAIRQRNVWDVSLVKGPKPGRCRVVESTGGGDLEEIPTDENHLFFSSWKKLQEMGLGPDVFKILREHGVEVELRSQNATPLSRGLGSSAALRVASAEVYRRLTGCDEREAWELAAQLEGHPDNAGAAGLGGLVLGTRDSGGKFRALQPPLHSCWTLALAVPNFALATTAARTALPTEVSRGDAIFNMGRLGFLLEGLRTGDGELVRLGCQDRLHQLQRARLVPGLTNVMEAAVEAGGTAAYLSGAGPTVAAFVDARKGEDVSSDVLSAMRGAFQKAGVEAKVEIQKVDRTGLEVLEACPSA